MSALREDTGSGLSPISPAIILGWRELTGNSLTRSDYAMIAEMDTRFRSAVATERENNNRRMAEGL